MPSPARTVEIFRKTAAPMALLAVALLISAPDLLAQEAAPSAGGSGVAANPAASPSQPGSSPGTLDFPRRKPGQWEIRSTASDQLGLPPTVLCVGPDTDRADHHLDRRVGKRGACRLGAFKRVGVYWMADSVCRDSRSTVVSQSTASGDFQTHYNIENVVLYSPPLANNKREDRESTHARYLGACPEGHVPGDMVIPSMGILNMLDGKLRSGSPASR
ncbi:MAG: hypothetical protein Q4D19_10715 [Lautropia sp.]|nr:hypothetical protein [Lautropia sp.]